MDGTVRRAPKRSCKPRASSAGREWKGHEHSAAMRGGRRCLLLLENGPWGALWWASLTLLPPSQTREAAGDRGTLITQQTFVATAQQTSDLRFLKLRLRAGFSLRLGKVAVPGPGSLGCLSTTCFLVSPKDHSLKNSPLGQKQLSSTGHHTKPAWGCGAG